MTPPSPTTSVFISYKSDDHDRVLPLVLGLRKKGLTVWWDRDVEGAQRWRQLISENLEEAACVLVCWTANSVALPNFFVHDEAQRAQARGVLLQVRLDEVSLPLGFGETQALPLIDWSGDEGDPYFEDVAAAASALAAGKRPPKPIAPLVQRRRRVRRGTVGLILLWVALFALDVRGIQQKICQTSLLRETCRGAQLGGVPSLEEEAACEAIAMTHECDRLRDHLTAYPEGYCSEAAERRITARLVETEYRWGEPSVKRLPLAITREGAAEATVEAAQAAAQGRAMSKAQSACGAYLQSEAHRLNEASIQISDWRCEAKDDGWRCGPDVIALCTLQVRRSVEVERCPAGG